MARYRVEELAGAAGVSVDQIRSYQTRGLLPAPRHEGRLAWYGERHLHRLHRIRSLRDEGHSLRVIAGMLGEEGSPVPADLDSRAEEELLSLDEVAERAGVHRALLRSLAGSGLLRGRVFGSEVRYTTADVRAVRMLLVLLGSGLPVEELVEVARPQLEAAEEVAHGAVELFLRYGRAPLLDAGLGRREEAERMVATLRLMMHAATALMTYQFQRMVLNAAQEAIEDAGTRSERAALAREAARRRFELDLPA